MNKQYFNNCSLCGSPKSLRLYLDTGNYHLLVCKKCIGGALVAPEIEHDDIYDKEYYKKNYHSIEKIQQDRVQGYLKKIEKYLPKAGSVLDIGCGAGVFLEECKKKGWETFGIDPSEAALSITSKRIGDNRVFSDIDLVPQNRRFSLITFFDSLVHIENLEEILISALARLEPRGVCIIRTPNNPKLFLRYVKILALGNRAVALQALHAFTQRYFFSPETFPLFAKKYGLNVLAIEKSPDYPSREKQTLSFKSKIKNFLRHTSRYIITKGNTSLFVVLQKN